MQFSASKQSSPAACYDVWAFVQQHPAQGGKLSTLPKAQPHKELPFSKQLWPLGQMGKLGTSHTSAV